MTSIMTTTTNNYDCHNDHGNMMMTAGTFCCKYLITFLYVGLQTPLPELTISESDPGPARLILVSNLPITCQGIASDYSPVFCWIRFTIRSSDDIAVRQRTPHHSSSRSVRNLCTYQLDEEDWRPQEGYAYNGSKSLDIVAKVHFVS